MMIPLANPVDRAQQLYNQSLIRTRNCVERQIGVWKRRFLALLYGLRCNMETNLAIIIATAILHNIAIDSNEGEPPLPENIDQEQLEYLLELGNIAPNVLPIQNDRINNVLNHRNNLIRQFFAQI